MAKQHSALTGNELHNPKGIGSESTGSLLILSQSLSAISASGHIVPSADNTYNLGSSTQRFKDVNFAGSIGNVSGSTISGSSLHIEGDGKVTGDFTIGGDITIGDADSDSISINADLTSNLIPNADNTYDLGSSAKQWKDIYINGTGYIDTFDAVTSTGIVSGSAVYGTILGQNRTDGLKTITIEANSIINQDLSTDADATLGTLAVGNVTSTGIVKAAGVLSGSSDAFFGQYGVSYISASNGSLQATNYISGSEVKAPTGTFGTATISAGTITGITDIAVADGGTGASSLTDGGVLLGSGTSAITAMAVLSDGEMIVGDGSTDPVAESGATLRTSIGVGTGDNVTFTNITGAQISGSGDAFFGQYGVNYVSASVGNIQATGYVSGSDIKGVSGDLGSLSVGNVTSTGTITGSAVYGTTIGQNRVDGVKTITIEANSTVNQDLTTDASPTFAGTTNGNVQVGVTGDNEIDTSGGNLTIDSSGGTTTIDDILSVADAATFDGTITAGGAISTAGILSGSSDAFFGQYGVSYVSASNGSLQATNYISGSDIKGVSGDLGSLSVGNVTSTGTISGSAVYGTTIGQNRTDGLKTITIEANSIVNQDVTSDANVAFNNITSTGTISGSAVYGTTIGQNRTDGLKTLTIESNSVVNQDLSSDASPTFGGLTSTGNVFVQGDITAENIIVSSSVTHTTQSFSSGSTIFGDTIDDTHRFTGSVFFGTGSLQSVEHITGSGVISGSEVYGTTIGQNRVDGVKTITIESNSTINQDVTTDANVTFNNVTSTGTVSGSAVYGTTIGQNRTDLLKTITIEANSIINQDGTSDASPTFAGTTAGNIKVGVTGDNELDTSSGNLTIDSAGGTITIDDILSVAGAATFDSTVLSTGNLSTAGILSGSSQAFFGQYGVSYVSASAGSIQATNYVSGSEVKAPTGTFGTIGAFTAGGAIDFDNQNMTNVDIDSGTITGITDLAVADGGTGAGTFTDGGVLLGSGTSAITAMAALGDGEMIVGDGSTDPVAESGATLRTSIGVGTGDSPQFTDLTLTGGDITITNAATDVDLKDNTTSALTFDAGAGGTSVLSIHTNDSAEAVEVQGVLKTSGILSGSSDAFFGQYGVSYVSASAGSIQATNYLSGSELKLGTALSVEQGGTGLRTITNGGIMLGSGTGNITPITLGNNEILVGDGSGDPNAESGNTARTSLGLGTGDSPTFTGLTLSGDIEVQGGDINLTNGETDIDVTDNSDSALSFDASGQAGILVIDSTDNSEGIRVTSLKSSGIISGSNEAYFGQYGVSYVSASAGSLQATNYISGSTVKAGGDIIAYNSSDRRLKDNLEVIQGSLDKVGKLAGYEFDWNDNQDNYKGHDYGVVAQEVQEIFPELVSERDGGYLGVKYEKLVPVLIESVKELKERVEEIEKNCCCLNK